MHLMLYRTYHPDGVNGELLLDGRPVCKTIELPWLHNRRNHSCIPEGSYVLKKRWSPKHKWHLEVTGVKGRNLVLIHPANDAKKELRGCIAPVGETTGWGKGIMSRMAFDKLTGLVFPETGKRLVLLTIREKAGNTA